jgi:MFS transporter, Spinster family, sphingosine-1-phosphate transporter
MDRPARPATPRPGAYWTLAALFGMNLLNYIDRFILAAVLEPVSDKLKLGEFESGLTFSIFYISYAVFSPLIGWFGDRVTRKYLLALGVGIWSLATFGTGLCWSFPSLLLARSLLGVGEATYATLAPALLADLFPRQQRNRVMTIFYVAVPVGAAVGYGLGGTIYDLTHDWRMAFFVVGLPGLAVALASLWLREPVRGAAEGVDEEQRSRHEALPLSWSVYATLLRNRSYVYNCLAMAMFTFALGGLQVFAPKFFIKVRGMEASSANLGLGIVVIISGLVGTSLGGWLGELWSRRWRGGYFWVSGLGMFASVPFIVFGLLATHPLVIFPSLTVGLTLAFVNIGPSNTILTNVALPKIRAASVAVNLLVIHILGDIPSPSLMGGVADLTGSLFWGVTVTLPAIVLGGIFFCLGAPHLEADQDAVLAELRSAKPH